jgi:ABC-type Fe3+/spermidine/putrescine transport system ATPase subunit
MKPFLSIAHISHSYGKTPVLKDCGFEVGEGELVALLGESGSGKTTMLRLIAGFERPSNGSIILQNRTLCSPTEFIVPERRNVGMVFQDYALFPHLSVGENIAIGQKKNASTSVEAWLELVGLGGLADRKTTQISGGQQQRVAIARALAAEPQVLLLDEPFSNIDESLKFAFRSELRDLLLKVGVTTIFVTHDTKDALAISDKIVVMKDGEIRQSGTPQAIYDRPHDTYVAGLLGPFNTVLSFYNGANIIRAEHVLIHPDGEHRGTVLRSIYQGGHYLVEVRTSDQNILMMRSDTHPAVQAEIQFTYAEHNVRTVTNR